MSHYREVFMTAGGQARWRIPSGQLSACAAVDGCRKWTQWCDPLVVITQSEPEAAGYRTSM